MADLRIDIASEFVGAKAFKQADTATSALTKQVNRLAKQYRVFTAHRNWLGHLLMQSKPLRMMTKQREFLARLSIT